jgi:DNA repair exonuclease SbcCD ATPase subunit
MKLDRLVISNFMRIASADIDLSASRLHCFCGPNEAGKSSISEAVRIALLGDTPRVDLKKNFSMLLSPGAKRGSIELVADGGAIQVKRDVSTGKAVNDPLANLSDAAISSMRIALGAQGFVDMTPDARRKMLFDVCEVSLGADEISNRLIAKGLPPDVVHNDLKPLLKGSVDAALATAKDKQKERRAQWTQVTKETFGEQKADGWEAPKPEKPGKKAAAIKDLAAAKKQVEKLDKAVEDAAAERGRIQAGVEQRRRFDEQLQRLQSFVENKDRIERDKQKIEAEIAELNTLIETNEDVLRRIAEASVGHLECPKCEQALQLNEDGTELEFAVPVEPFTDLEGEEKRRADLADFKARKKKLEDELATVNKRLDAVNNNVTLSKSLNEQRAALPTENQLVEAEKALNDARLALQVEREVVQEAIDYAAKVKQAEEATDTARKLFISWKFWGDVAKYLEPSGIPGEILSEALEKLNRRLAASAALAGWCAPYIRDDMSIVRVEHDEEEIVERPYQLLSESAKWRMSAVIAEVISNMAGMKFLILDRWDVLDGTGRLQFMKWVRILAEADFDTIITFATLKGSADEKPQLKGFEVHWVEGGAVS